MPSFPFTLGGETSDEATPFATQLLRLLPPGQVWNLEPDSVLRKTLTAVGDELERVRVRGLNLVSEGDPRSASETISDWERALGLPDTRVTEIPSSLAERQVAVTQKVVNRGGQNYGFFESLCGACGYPLHSITRYVDEILRVGFRVSDRVYGAGYAYSMLVTLDAPTGSYLEQASFERVIRHATHAHIQVLFEYL